MENEDLTGRIIKALKDNPVGINICKGEYMSIVSGNLERGKIVKINGSLHFYTSTFYKDCWELMPIDFNTDVPKEELMFKKGEYIVILLIWKGDLFSQNYIYKQKSDDEKLVVYKDGLEKSVKMFSISFDNKETWRYATKEEIKEYERIGHPYDTTTLTSPKNCLYKVGDVVVCIKGFTSDYYNEENYGGSGYIDGECSKIKNIDINFPDKNVIWKTSDGGGIFINAIRIATEEERNYYEKKGRNYNIEEIEKNNISKEKIPLINIGDWLKFHNNGGHTGGGTDNAKFPLNVPLKVEKLVDLHNNGSIINALLSSGAMVRIYENSLTASGPYHTYFKKVEPPKECSLKYPLKEMNSNIPPRYIIEVDSYVKNYEWKSEKDEVFDKKMLESRKKELMKRNVNVEHHAIILIKTNKQKTKLITI